MTGQPWRGMRSRRDTRSNPAAVREFRAPAEVRQLRQPISNVRITDAAGHLVAEFSSSSPGAAEKLIAFWCFQLPDETLTIERGHFEQQPPICWTSIPVAEEVYARRLPWLRPDSPD